MYILIGIPCSGKSTYTAKYLRSPNTIIISSDKIRKDLTGTYQVSPETNDLVFDIVKNEVQEALSQGLDVVVDATNIYKKHRKSFLKAAKSFGCHSIAIVFKVPITVCLKRNSKRSVDKQVPEHIIINMSEFNYTISNSEGFNEIKYI